MTDTNNNLLEMRGVTKRFPGVVANNNIDLDVRYGEFIHYLEKTVQGKALW